MKSVALAGNPNCGKTTLFNRLTGLNHKVGNYPGVTVDSKEATANFGDGQLKIIDLPGTYSLIARSKDESVAYEVLAGHNPAQTRPDLVLILADASNLERNLYLALSILEMDQPAVLVLNMMDLANKQGLKIDIETLSATLGIPVVPVIANRNLPKKAGGPIASSLAQAQKERQEQPGLEELKRTILDSLDTPKNGNYQSASLPSELEQGLNTLMKQQSLGRSAAVWLLSSLAAQKKETQDEGSAEFRGFSQAAVESAQEILPTFKCDFAAAVVESRYRQVSDILASVLTKRAQPQPSTTDRLDSFLLHPVFGLLFFISAMALLFQSLFSWSDPFIGFIEDRVGDLQSITSELLPEGALADLLIDGVIGGVGNVIVFVPQIAFLFLFIAIMEDSGYLARAAYISDRFMARIGLHGRAFVPLLSGFACAVPAIMAARAVENSKDRLVTILVTPLVSCSARLPVYTLFIAALFAADTPVFGPFTQGGVLMLCMYLLSTLATVGIAFLLKRTILRSPTPPLVLELPPYRLPQFGSVLRRVYDRCKVFVIDAGTVILACSIVLWALLYFPNHVPESFKLQQKQAQLAQKYGNTPKELSVAQASLEKEAQAARIEASIAGQIGHFIEPAIRPLGYDWKIGIGLLASFAAREVLVSTMGLIYGVGGDVDEESVPLRQRLREEIDPVTLKPVYTPLKGLSLMVFFVLAMQCMSTLAAIKRETNSWKWPLFAVTYMTFLAWFGALVVYQGGQLLGYS